MLSDSVLAHVLHLGILVVGCVLLLRKVAEMDSYHNLRVVVLTAIFSSPFIFFFILYVYYVFNSPVYSCVNSFD